MGAAGFPGALLVALRDISSRFGGQHPPWKRLLEQAKAPT